MRNSPRVHVHRNYVGIASRKGEKRGWHQQGVSADMMKEQQAHLLILLRARTWGEDASKPRSGESGELCQYDNKMNTLCKGQWFCLCACRSEAGMNCSAPCVFKYSLRLNSRDDSSVELCILQCRALATSYLVGSGKAAQCLLELIWHVYYNMMSGVAAMLMFVDLGTAVSHIRTVYYTLHFHPVDQGMSRHDRQGFNLIPTVSHQQHQQQAITWKKSNKPSPVTGVTKRENHSHECMLHPSAQSHVVQEFLSGPG